MNRNAETAWKTPFATKRKYQIAHLQETRLHIFIRRKGGFGPHMAGAVWRWAPYAKRHLAKHCASHVGRVLGVDAVAPCLERGTCVNVPPVDFALQGGHRDSAWGNVLCSFIMPRKATNKQTKQIKELLRKEKLSFAQVRQMFEEEVISAEQFEDLKAWLREKVRKQIRRTRALKFYLFKFAFRIVLFFTVFVLYLTHRDALEQVVNQPFFYQVTPLHAVWALFMCIMVSHLVPNNRLTMAWRKARGDTYRPVEGYDKLALLEYVQDQNVKAWRVMLAWLSFNAVFGILYLVGVLHAGDLVMLTVFFYLSDYICILLLCPFQLGIMKNRCCINCRIYDWGHFMMFTPMLFIKNFFSWSLFFTSVVVLIHWEMQYAKHPERFWSGSNRTLQCGACQEKTCRLKKRLGTTVPTNQPGA